MLLPNMYFLAAILESVLSSLWLSLRHTYLFQFFSVFPVLDRVLRGCGKEDAEAAFCIEGSGVIDAVILSLDLASFST